MPEKTQKAIDLKLAIRNEIGDASKSLFVSIYQDPKSSKLTIEITGHVADLESSRGVIEGMGFKEEAAALFKIVGDSAAELTSQLNLADSELPVEDILTEHFKGQSLTH